MQGFVAGVYSNVLRYGLHIPRVRQLFGVTHSVAASNQAGQHEVFRGASGIKTFESPGSLPRAWIVHRVKQVASEDELRAFVEDPRVDLPREAASLEPPPALESCDLPETAAIEERGYNRVRVRVKTACTGMLIYAETWAAGWEAHVDGAPARLYEPFGVFRGVVVGKGEHEVVMEYRPQSVRIGFILSALGWCAVGVVVWLARRGGHRAATRRWPNRK
jgi:hypothetical protein